MIIGDIGLVVEVLLMKYNFTHDRTRIPHLP